MSSSFYISCHHQVWVLKLWQQPFNSFPYTPSCSHSVHPPQNRVLLCLQNVALIVSIFFLKPFNGFPLPEDV